jgi:hypothetical protein
MTGGECTEVYWRGKCISLREVWGWSNHVTFLCGCSIVNVMHRNESLNYVTVSS